MGRIDPLAAGAEAAIARLGTPFLWWLPATPTDRREAMGVLRQPDRDARLGMAGAVVTAVSLRVAARAAVPKDAQLEILGIRYRVTKVETDLSARTDVLILTRIDPQ